jgi:hypothetical protein
VTSADWHSECLNCGTGLHGRFCSQCGQRVIPRYPSLPQLLGSPTFPASCSCWFRRSRGSYRCFTVGAASRSTSHRGPVRTDGYNRMGGVDLMRDEA